MADLLPADILSKLYAIGYEQTYVDREMIQQRGDSWRGISIVTSGQAVAANIGRDGSIIPSSLIRRGGSFGEFTTFLNLPRSHSIWADGTTKIRHIKRDEFLAILSKEPSIERALLTLMVERNHELVGIMDAQRRLSLPARLTRLLVTEIDHREDSVTIDCRQEDLSFMLGVSRVAVGKALNKLVALNLVQTGYRKITVPDTAKLLQFLDEQDPLSSIDL